MINAVLRYEDYCLSLKKSKHFYSWEQGKFQTSSLLHEEGIPSCWLLSLCLHHTCACGGQSSSINYSSAIGMAVRGCQEQKRLMVCWMPLNVPTVICNSHQAIDLISSALLLHPGPRACTKMKYSAVKAGNMYRHRLTYHTGLSDIRDGNSCRRIAYRFHEIW